MPLPDGRPSLYDLNPGRYSATRAAADKINQANAAHRASPNYQRRLAEVRAALGSHHSDVPAKGSGAHGGNPNHDEHGRFT